MQSQDLFNGSLPSLEKAEDKYPVKIGEYCRVFYKPDSKTIEGLVVSYFPRDHRFLYLLTLEGNMFKVASFTAKKIPFSSLPKEKEHWAVETTNKWVQRQVVETEQKKPRQKRQKRSTSNFDFAA